MRVVRYLNNLEYIPADLWMLLCRACRFIRPRSPLVSLCVGQVWQCRNQQYWAKVTDRDYGEQFSIMVMTSLPPTYTPIEFAPATIDMADRYQGTYRLHEDSDSDYDLVNLLKDA